MTPQREEALRLLRLAQGDRETFESFSLNQCRPAKADFYRNS